MEEKMKILLCGDVEGRFRTLFEKVENINKKSGPFDLVLCVGNFFGVNNKEFQDYRNGIKKDNITYAILVVVPTYILGSNKEDSLSLYPEDSELCPNISYLGKRGLYVTSNGLKIAYLSGISSREKQPKDYNFSIDDVLTLRDVCIKDGLDYRGVDILLTSQWPTDVTNLSPNSSIQMQNGSDVVAWLAVQLKPRYHICGLEGIYYERKPYRIAGTNSSLEAVTRFIALGRVGNSQKHKWIYALQLKPIDKMNMMELLQKTTDETEVPYNTYELENKVLPSKRKQNAQQYFYDMTTPIETVKGKQMKRQKIEYDQNKCWFCLASSAVEKHLIITVGTHAYVTLPKGGIVDEHLLICPVQHHQNSINLPEETLCEIEQFKKAITSFFARNDKVPVFFERNYKTSHMQIQCIPIPKTAQKELAEIYQEEAEGHGFKLDELDCSNRLDQVIPSNSPYFFLELPTGKKLYTKIQHSKDFPINFGREVLATGPILNKTDRVEWKDCLLEKEDENALVKRIRTDFEPFDITDY